MNFTEDSAAQFVDFGVDATLDGVAVSGIFDNGSQSALNNTMLGTNPTFTLASASASSSSRSKTLVVDSVSYTVREVKPDGTGMTMLELEAQ